jgi:hypothetical protein
MTRIYIAIVSTALVFAALACGGDDKKDGILGGGGSGGSTSNDPATFARQALVTFMGVFSGNTDPQRMLDLYLPECRTNVKASDITQVLTMIKAFFPELSKVKIEDIDLGATKVDRSGSDVTVTVQDPKKIRFKIDGMFVPVEEYLKKVGFDSISDSPFEGTEEPLKLREVNGKLFITECDDLKDIADSNTSQSATPTPQRPSATPTPLRSSTTTAVGPTATPGRTATQTAIGSTASTPQRGNTPTAGNAVVRTTPTAAQRFPAAIDKEFMDDCTGAGATNTDCRCMFNILQVRYDVTAYREFERALDRGERMNELNAIVQACVGVR